MIRGPGRSGEAGCAGYFKRRRFDRTKLAAGKSPAFPDIAGRRRDDLHEFGVVANREGLVEKVIVRFCPKQRLRRLGSQVIAQIE
jgi:hypothetical protein